MASNSETGHAINIANLNKLNKVNEGFGASYQPSNPLLTLGMMKTQYETCFALQEEVNVQNGIFIPIVNARQILFRPIKPLVRRIRSAVKVSGANVEFYNDVNTIVTKLLGERMSKVATTANDPAGTSTSQQSYDNQANFFGAMIELLRNELLYVPNETALKVVTLEILYADMNAANDAVKAGIVPHNNALIARNVALYTRTTGLTDVGQASKDYVRSVFGYSSPEFKLVSGIKFRRSVKID